MSFWGVLSGGNQKRRINQSYDAANAAYGTANTKAKSYLDAGYDTAKGYIDPIIQSGQAGGKLYQDTLGINGADARTAAQGVYNSDDMLAQQRALDLKRSGQVQNASGSFNSGTAALADSRARLQDYGNWQNKLQGEEGRGDQAAGLGASLATNNATQQAGREEGYGSALAGSEVQRGAALSANDNTGVNNLFKLGGLAVSAFSPTYTPGQGYSGASPASSMWGAVTKGWNGVKNALGGSSNSGSGWGYM